MTTLGRPGDFLRVTIRQVAGPNYRVNVVTGADAASAKIAHSFYIGIDDGGNVVRSSPPLTKQY